MRRRVGGEEGCEKQLFIASACNEGCCTLLAISFSCFSGFKKREKENIGKGGHVFVGRIKIKLEDN